MRKLKLLKPVIPFLTTLTMLSVAPFVLAAGLELKTEAFHEVEVVAKDGKKTKKIEPMTRALPGQEVIYTITYKNAGTEPADKVVVNNPVPQGLVFQPGSMVGAGAVAEVSVDGGVTFGALEKLKVKDLPAKATDVTHVRWVLSSAVKPNGEGKVTYRALLK